MAKSWILTAVLLAGPVISCASNPKRGDKDADTERRISEPAQAMLSRIYSDKGAAGIIVDFEAAERVGFRAPNIIEQLSQIVDLMLPRLLDSNDEEAEESARAAVAWRLIRQSSTFPRVQRIGVLVSQPLAAATAAAGAAAGATMDGAGVLAQSRAGLIVAVDQPEASSAELLLNIATAGRATELEGGKWGLAHRGGALCMGPRAGTREPVCARSGDGYYLLSSALALDELARPASEKASVPEDVLLFVRADLGATGAVQIRIAGRSSLDVTVDLSSQDSTALSRIEFLASGMLAQLDAEQQGDRELVSKALEEVRQRILQDASATPRVKQTATQLTAERVLDPDGHWTSMRRSMTITPSPGKLTIRATIPEGAVRSVAEGGIWGIAAVGAASNVLNVFCRANQKDALTALDAGRAAQTVHISKTQRAARRVTDLRLTVPPSGRYALCLGEDCRCEGQGCPALPEAIAACSPHAGVTNKKTAPKEYTLCAVGSADSDTRLDVWTLSSGGAAANVVNDCE